MLRNRLGVGRLRIFVYTMEIGMKLFIPLGMNAQGVYNDAVAMLGISPDMVVLVTRKGDQLSTPDLGVPVVRVEAGQDGRPMNITAEAFASDGDIVIANGGTTPQLLAILRLTGRLGRADGAYRPSVDCYNVQRDGVSCLDLD